MMRVIHEFSDLYDDMHVYNVGDEYPRVGIEVSEERIAELSTKNNKIGVPLIIVEPKTEKAEPKEEKIDAEPIKVEPKPKKKTTARK